MTMRLSMCFLLLGTCVAATASGATPASLRIGLLVDSSGTRGAQEGLRVLGATPGSVADRLGLRPGDVIVDVNGVTLANLGVDARGRSLAAAAFNASLTDAAATTPLRLRVLRNGVTLAMNAQPQEATGPAHDKADAPTVACGRISTFDVAPRSAHQYHAKILLLDGTTPGPSGAQSFRVSVGTHTLRVAEDIPTREMGVGPIASLRAQRDNSKMLTVNVKANTTIQLAAQLHPHKAADLAHADYWDPVIWREIPETCP